MVVVFVLVLVVVLVLGLPAAGGGDVSAITPVHVSGVLLDTGTRVQRIH